MRASRAQLSLEYLIILAAFFSFLFLLLPSLYRVYHAGIFSMDVRNAESFLNSFGNAVSSLDAFENGSKKELQSKILGEWVIYSEGKTLFIIVNNSALEKSKALSTRLVFPVQLQRANAEESIKIKLKKEHSIISAEYG